MRLLVLAILARIADARDGRLYMVQDEAVLPRIVMKEIEEKLRD